MPISLNLLAEAQAAQEVKRKDPVKRTLYIAVALVVMVLIWSSSLQVKMLAYKSKLNSLQRSLSARTNEYDHILTSQKRLGEVTERLAALNRLGTNRFLEADMLDALQRSTCSGVQLSKLRVDQGFFVQQPVKKVDVGDGTIIPGKPGFSTERTMLILDGRDSSANPGTEAIARFKETLACTPYFHAHSITTNEITLRSLSTPQVDNETGGAFVLFTLECKYPDKVRQQ